MTATTHPEGFQSLAELQEQHAALVKEVGTGVLDGGNPVRIAEFVQRGVATGAILDAREDRAAAQALINFWASRLKAAAREAYRKLAEEEATVSPRPTGRSAGDGDTLLAEFGTLLAEFDPATLREAAARAEFDTLLAEFDPATLREAAARADAWLASLPDVDRVTARRVLIRLVRLLADQGTFDPVPIVRGALYDLDAPERVNAVVDGLAAAGVVRVSRGESLELDRVTLRSADLTTRWEAYAGWLADRRRFREAVAGWDRAGRPSGELAIGERLEEARLYFDRDNLEREFLEQSRYREWRDNERNRILKWVFLSMALAALVGWFVAGVLHYRANQEARLAREAEEVAENASAALRGKQQLTNLRLLVRAMGEGTAARTVPALEIARARWKALLLQFEGDPQAAFLGNQRELEELGKRAMRQDARGEPWKNDLDRIRRLRNRFIDNDEVSPTLKVTRDVSFAMVKLSAMQVVNLLKANKPPSDVEPFAREFWAQYWGEMLLVEGDTVESAMVAFGNALEEVWAEVENPGRLETNLKSRFTEKGKQLLQGVGSLQLNAASFARLHGRAKELDIADADWKRIQNDLNRSREEALSRPVKDQRLVTDLGKQLQPLLDALKREGLLDRIPRHRTAKR